MVGLLIAGGGGVAALALLMWALSLRRRLLAEQRVRARAEGLAAAREAEIAHLAAVRVPAIAERTRTGRLLDGVPGPVGSDAELGAAFARALAAVVTALGSDEAVRRERALRDSVQSAFESVARTMHAMATVQQQVLDHIERSIDDPRLMAEVMKADHAAAQMTRKAQTLLVMCGIWPARRESRPVSLYDCVRGAQSRIVEFGRVEVHGGQTLHVVPPAVEGLMHAVAELLENATVFSPSSTQVVVTVREVAAGAVVEIDDAGLGMPPDVLAQATAHLRDDPDLARLGAVPRLGLACAGRWGRELGFSVELTSASAYGGTRAVTFVPHRLLTEPLANPAPLRREPAVEPRAPGHAPSRPATGEGEPHPRSDGPDPAVQSTSGPASGVGPGVGPATGPVPPGGGSATGLPATGHPVPGGGPGSGSAAPGATPRDVGPAPADGPAPPPGGLPRRRSRRGREPGPERGTGQSHGAPSPPDPGTPWTPEAARASISGVVSGTRRGRAALENGTPTPRAADRGTDHRTDHEGGRQ
ncbi:ATP-binding protein [Streptomyces sp. HNM0645]|uniref:ATP-binding protein n=1 Tax=Streptomyces sp. HNM0645 TaxID=2782343 RepID=UPI0024B6430F|nr:ATP-binding protein [Streptomyces sp. HNM0645]MDI9885064.1 ATP-binding protein [Streptomyces sp. HNM0645]